MADETSAEENPSAEPRASDHPIERTIADARRRFLPLWGWITIIATVLGSVAGAGIGYGHLATHEEVESVVDKKVAAHAQAEHPGAKVDHDLLIEMRERQREDRVTLRDLRWWMKQLAARNKLRDPPISTDDSPVSGATPPLP